MTSSIIRKSSVPQEHLDQAKHNEQLARALLILQTPNVDWIITLSYYSALHYVYSKLTSSTVFSTHSKLEAEILKQYTRNSKLWVLYKKLQDASKNARYLPHVSREYRKNLGYGTQMLQRLDDLKKELGI